MASVVHWLDAPLPVDWPAKAVRLAELGAAGLPVPPGLVVAADPGVLDDPSTRAAIDRLLTRGPVVVRSALHGEDDAQGSAAGLGRSTLDCRDPTEVREALHTLATQRDDPWLRAYQGDGATDQGDVAIVQHQVPRAALLVVAVPRGGEAEVEVHTAAGEVLAQGASPVYAGALSAWEHPARPEVATLIARAVAALSSTEHGHDLEVVVDPHDRPHLVQARPLVTPLHPGWPAFREAVDEQGRLEDLHGVLTLDAEHNPAPLSPAHAWLMGWLAHQRPTAGDPTVLAGWLYMRTLPRDLARHRNPSSGTAPPPSARQVVQRLHEHTLPQARARLGSLTDALEQADANAVARALPRAQAAFLEMIDTYVGLLVPARTRARRALVELAADPSQPLCIRGRDPFLDVLPATWDLASKSLAQLGATTSAEPMAMVLPTDEATAATLLGEWDDHLFALGLAPLRAWFLAAGRVLALEDDVFMLTAPEVVHALQHDITGLPPRIVQRRALAHRHAQLRPPLRIRDGRPVSFGRKARLGGIPLGETFVGPLAPRSDLADLLADPPGPDAIVVLPSLTAPAAVALHQLGIRAVCCEHGGALSHAALMVRELGLSALIGCRGCTQLPAGRQARIDITAGRLIVQPPSDPPTA